VAGSLTGLLQHPTDRITLTRNELLEL
jgi:hypothetical protein